MLPNSAAENIFSEKTVPPQGQSLFSFSFCFLPVSELLSNKIASFEENINKPDWEMNVFNIPV